MRAIQSLEGSTGTLAVLTKPLKTRYQPAKAWEEQAAQTQLGLPLTNLLAVRFKGEGGWPAFDGWAAYDVSSQRVVKVVVREKP